MTDKDLVDLGSAFALDVNGAHTRAAGEFAVERMEKIIEVLAYRLHIIRARERKLELALEKAKQPLVKIEVDKP